MTARCPYCGSDASPPLPLTTRQAELLMFIREAVRSTGVSPSYEEMRIGMGLTSKGTIFNMIRALERRNVIARLPGHARSVTPVMLP